MTGAVTVTGVTGSDLIDIEGVGNFNDDSIPDFAVLERGAGGGNYAIYIFEGSLGGLQGGGGIDTTATRTLGLNPGADGFRLVAPGDIDGVNGNFEELILSRPGEAFVIWGRPSSEFGPGILSVTDSSIALRLTESDLGTQFLVAPVGDIGGTPGDGGVSDLAVLGFARSAGLIEDGSILEHQVVRIYFGSEKLAALEGYRTPDLQIEPESAFLSARRGAGHREGDDRPGRGS